MVEVPDIVMTTEDECLMVAVGKALGIVAVPRRSGVPILGMHV